MSWKESALLELKHLESSLSDQKNEIENGVENMEGKKKVRDHERKEILLLEMKHLLSKLNCWWTYQRSPLTLVDRRGSSNTLMVSLATKLVSGQ